MGNKRFWPQAAGLALLLLASGAAPAALWSTATIHKVVHRTADLRSAAAQAISPVLQLQEDLAALGYLPVGWNGEAFTFPQVAMPAPLRELFVPGKETPLLRGAVMSYEAAQGLVPSRTGMHALLASLQGDLQAGRLAQHPFTYVYVDRTVPERLVVWSAKGVLQSVPANTGVAGAVTPTGTFPVYLRLPFQVMRGRNLDGIAYADPVHYISYFAGGDAVHGFVRQAYGFPQSLGCVELPPVDAGAIYWEIQIGTLVTVGAGTLSFVEPPAPVPPGLAVQTQRLR